MNNIFVTTGTQLPFKRLVNWTLQWAEKNITATVKIQAIGLEYSKKNVSISSKLKPSEYDNAIKGCTKLVGHAGIGTIITAHENNLPLIMIPREFTLGEHRNNHQAATANKFSNVTGIYIARSFEEYEELLNRDDLEKCSANDSKNRNQFVENLIDLLEKI